MLVTVKKALYDTYFVYCILAKVTVLSQDRITLNLVFTLYCKGPLHYLYMVVVGLSTHLQLLGWVHHMLTHQSLCSGFHQGFVWIHPVCSSFFQISHSFRHAVLQSYENSAALVSELWMFPLNSAPPFFSFYPFNPPIWYQLIQSFPDIIRFSDASPFCSAQHLCSSS